MHDFWRLLRGNRNYRCTWLGQVVSEIGDFFNNVAVLSLVVQTTGSGLALGGLMLARAIPAVLAAPIAGVALDRLDRRRIMIASDVVRAVVALGFVLVVIRPSTWLLYLLSALLMFASPFFASGRAAILPAIASADELHTANSLTQTTQWATLTIGTMLAGFAVAKLGFAGAFVIDSASFVLSAIAISALRHDGGFAARRATRAASLRPWHEYREGLVFVLRTPLVLGIGLVSVGWAAGGGAAQILFALFGEQVFGRGPAGIGTIWGFAGIGLLAGAVVGHVLGGRVDFAGYKRAVSVSYLTHGAAYAAFSVTREYATALAWIAASRVGMATTSILNYTQLLRHTPDGLRGRVFSTLESLRWSTMIVSFAVAGIASRYYSPRAIGVVAGALGALTGALWALADWAGKLPEPSSVEADAAEPAPFDSATQPV